MKTKIKKIMLGLGLALLGSFSSSAQVGLEGIVVEKYYQTNAADAALASSQGATLNVGSVVYRVYVDLAAGWRYNLAFGNANHDWKITTTTNFFNDPNNGVPIGPQGTSLNNTRTGLMLIDSWLTTGGVCAGKAGIRKIEDGDGAVSNLSGVLTNSLGGIFGAPINSLVSVSAKDGLTPSTATTVVVPTQLGIGSSADCFDQTPGNQFLNTGGSVAALGGVVGTGTANMVLIGQFTTDGIFGFEFNIQVQNLSSPFQTENYVAKNVQAGEFLFAGLTLAPPSVGITSPSNGANFVTGSPVAITATAAATGSISSVEFKVDGVSLLIDNTAPYTANYTSVAGSHTITATATDNNSLTATSSNVVISVANNQAPTVSVAAPAGAITGQMVTFTATANDVDGTVASVSFSVDNVAIGTTTGPAYTATWTAIFGAHSVKAAATDNLGAVGVSAPVAFNVVNNIPPSAAVTNPLNNAVVTGTTGISVISITATAADVDGTVTGVEAFVNNVSIGVDATSPYTFTYSPSVYGGQIIKVVATDNAAATTTSSPITVNFANANAKPYEITTVTQKCNQGTFCLPIGTSPSYTVDNVIGIDIVLLYDAAKVTPTGSITVNAGVITPSYVTVINSINNGTMNISAYLNGNAPGSAKFNGVGEIFCVGFVKNVMSAGGVDTAKYSISSLDESYITSVVPQLVADGDYRIYRDTMLPGRLMYANTGVPVRYNSANSNDYLVTNIVGNSFSVCPTSTTGLVAVQPDLNGDFIYNVTKGDQINISKDILPGTNVQPVINTGDQIIGRAVVLNSVGLTPSVYQIIALDVNLDGQVSAGDLSQMNQRSVLAIPEFKQAWNYNINGTPNGAGASKDYMFIDSVRLQTNAAYAISANYPLNDLVGYSKYKVPNTPFCLTVRQSSLGSCPTLTFEVYKGVMLGDADLSVSSASGTLQLRPSGDKVVIDLSKSVVNGNSVEVPVSFVSSTPVLGLDFAMKFEESKLNYKEMINFQSSLTDGLAYLNPNDKTLRFTATNVDLSPFMAHQAVASIRFETTTGNVEADQLNSLVGYLNGEVVAVEVLDRTVGLNTINGDNSASIFPNPTNGILNVNSVGDANVEIFDVTGKQVLLQTTVNANKTKQINVSELSNGVYFVKISNNDFVTIKKMVLSK